MYTHLLLISTVQFSRAYCSFFYYNIFIVSEQVFLRFFMNLSRHAAAVHTPLSREVFWHEYAKIPRHTSQNSIAAGNLE